MSIRGRYSILAHRKSATVPLRHFISNTADLKMEKKSGRIDVDYVASLARIELTEDEKRSLSADMEKIVAYVDLLAEKDVSGIEPTAHALSVSNVWRKDIAGQPFDREIMLRTAPEKIGGELIKVPQVIQGEEES